MLDQVAQAVELQKSNTLNDIELKNKEKEELDKQKKEYEALNMKLVHEKENLNGLNKLKEELSNKYNEILRNEEQMNLLKPYSEKLPTYNEFKVSLIDLNNFNFKVYKNVNIFIH